MTDINRAIFEISMHNSLELIKDIEDLPVVTEELSEAEANSTRLRLKDLLEVADELRNHLSNLKLLEMMSALLNSKHEDVLHIFSEEVIEAIREVSTTKATIELKGISHAQT